MITDNKKLCECDSLKKEGRGFDGWNDYYSFKSFIENNSYFMAINIGNPVYGELGMIENCYRCKKCEASWCLVEPEPPYAGQWVKVE